MEQLDGEHCTTNLQLQRYLSVESKLEGLNAYLTPRSNHQRDAWANRQSRPAMFAQKMDGFCNGNDSIG